MESAVRSGRAAAAQVLAKAARTVAA
jgi:hypothetical protein